MAFYDQGRKEKNFETGIEMALARVLASPQFIYRIEEETAPRTGSAAARRFWRASGGRRQRAAALVFG